MFRPADANETAAGWRIALGARTCRPRSCLTRQALPVLDPRALPVADAARGGYVLEGDADPDVILIGTGSEVHVALAARGLLRDRGVSSRVVSLPSWELFEEQPESYRDRGAAARDRGRASVSRRRRRWAGSATWGLHGAVIGLDRFGASAPGATVLKHLGFTPERVADEAERVLQAASIPSGGAERRCDS